MQDSVKCCFWRIRSSKDSKPPETASGYRLIGFLLIFPQAIVHRARVFFQQGGVIVAAWRLIVILSLVRDKLFSNRVGQPSSPPGNAACIAIVCVRKMTFVARGNGSAQETEVSAFWALTPEPWILASAHPAPVHSAVPLSEHKMGGSTGSVFCWPFKRVPEFPTISLWQTATPLLSQPCIMWVPFSVLVLSAGGPTLGIRPQSSQWQPPTAEISPELQLLSVGAQPALSRLCPSYQPLCSLHFWSLVIRVLSSKSSIDYSVSSSVF